MGFHSWWPKPCACPWVALTGSSQPSTAWVQLNFCTCIISAPKHTSWVQVLENHIIFPP